MDSKEQPQAAEEQHPRSPGTMDPLPETAKAVAKEQAVAHTRQVEHPLGHHKSHVEEQIAGGQEWQHQEGHAHKDSGRGGGGGR